MIFENDRAKQYYEEITQLHGVDITAPDDMVLTEKSMWECLQDIYKRNYNSFKII